MSTTECIIIRIRSGSEIKYKRIIHCYKYHKNLTICYKSYFPCFYRVAYILVHKYIFDGHIVLLFWRTFVNLIVIIIINIITIVTANIIT